MIFILHAKNNNKKKSFSSDSYQIGIFFFNIVDIMEQVLSLKFFKYYNNEKFIINALGYNSRILN